MFQLSYCDTKTLPAGKQLLVPKFFFVTSMEKEYFFIRMALERNFDVTSSQGTALQQAQNPIQTKDGRNFLVMRTVCI